MPRVKGTTAVPRSVIERIVEEYERFPNYTALANKLNDEGVATPWRGQWWAASVRSVLLRERERQQRARRRAT